MKKLSFHTFLILALTLLMLVTGYIVREQLFSKLSEMSKKHIDEIALVQSEVMRRTYQQVEVSIEDIVYLLEHQEGDGEVPTRITQLSLSSRAIIERAFHSIPSLTSLSILKNDVVVGRVEFDGQSNTLIDAQPHQINLRKKAVRGNLHRAYTKEDGEFYFEPEITLKAPYRLVFQLSPNRFFESIIDFLEDKQEVGFYLVDKYNGTNISSYQGNGLLSDERVRQIIEQRPLSINHNAMNYRIIYYGNDRSQFILFTAIPDTVISKQFMPIVNELGTQLIVSFILMLVSIYLITRLSTFKINQITDIATKISNFDFSKKQYPTSLIAETSQLSSSINTLETTIQNMQELIVNVSSANSLNELYNTLNESVIPAYGSQFSLFYIHEEHCIDANTHQEQVLEEVFNYASSTLNDDDTTTYKYDVYDESGHIIGVFFLRSHPGKTLSVELQAFIDQLSHLAGISLSKYQLLKQQKNLLASFTKAIASAIDAKSPHTGGHCQRVPELTMAMVEAAQNDQQSWAHFNLSEEELEEVYLAAWLHDCGKLTTQDHVIDKSTKLDMFGNRIHEVRTRFEILKRDIHIHYLTEKLDSPTLEKVKLQCQPEWGVLNAEFELIAKLNLGETFVSEHDLAALHRISSRSYQRTLDASIGLSWEERQRTTAKDYIIGIQESVLADKRNHIIKWEQPHKGEDRFTLKPPKYKYNFGEIYNLSIPKGTLTPEERFLINDHIIQTIKILETLPYPNYLSSIPLIAGGHHEKMSGEGYPLSIEAEHLPISARMIAIADIFEALTAKDRPYKTPKSLSQALVILANMAKDRHVDPKLLTLFIEQEVYLTYANQHLNPEQIDTIDHQSLFAIYQS